MDADNGIKRMDLNAAYCNKVLGVFACGVWFAEDFWEILRLKAIKMIAWHILRLFEFFWLDSKEIIAKTFIFTFWKLNKKFW